jgi:Zn-dependent protease with chaperone function
MDLPSPPEQRAVYLDGQSSRKRDVTLRFSGALDIVEQDVVVATWSYAEVRRADGPPGLLRLGCETALPLARLEVGDEATIRMIAANCRSLQAGHAAPAQTWRIVGWSLAAVASILGIAYFGIPYAADRIAPLVPTSFERRMGDAVDKQARAIFGGNTCSDAAGQAAFSKMIDKLRTAGGMDTPIKAHVLSSSMPNAFALPGGTIYLLDGLLQKAESVDEVAGVMAHELGHVHHRDSLRRIIQAGGTSYLIGLLFGDVMGGGAMVFVTRELFDSSHSRAAERAADGFARDAMHKLGRSPKPLGQFLLRVTGAQASKTISILASHPLSEDRLAAMSREDRPATGAPILTPAEWQALKTICKAK